MIFRKYRELEVAYYKGDKKSLDYIAAESLFTSVSYRFNEDSQQDKFLFLKVIKEVLFKSFKKIPSKIISQDSSVAVLDNSFNCIEIRKKYIEKLTGDKIKIVFSKSTLLGYSGFINTFKSFFYIFYFFFKSYLVIKKGIVRTNYALLIKQIPEIINLIEILEENKITILFDFANYEVDSNFLYLILKEKGVKVYKVPSPGPLFMHNKNLLTDVLVICSGYHLEETRLYKETIIFKELVQFYPELSDLAIKKNIVADDKKKFIVGFYSHASWLREKKKHVDNGLNLLRAEESLLKLINETFENTNYQLLIFLHPREKHKIDETEAYYKNFLSNIRYEFAPVDKKSTDCYHLCNLALITLSTILFERIFEGHKILISKQDIVGFPNPNSLLNNICFSNSSELSMLLEENSDIKDHDFFEKYKLSDYMSEKFISDEYK